MIDYKYFNLFQYEKGNVDKDWKIEYDGGSFTDWDMFSESIELTESLCSEKELRFGCCEAGCLKFKVANIVKPLINEWITVKVNIDHHEDESFVIGRYKVASEKLTADRQYKDIVAYDAMYDIINADVADWYNTVLPEKTSTVTLAQFRTSFMQYFGISEHVPEGGLVNDDMIVERTIEPEQISGKDVITAICEINGCFGHIGRDGKFHYIYLPQAIEGLYPANDLFPDRAPEHMVQAKTEHLYPQDQKGTGISKNVYIKVDYEDFRTKPITMLQIRQSENEIGIIFPEREMTADDNCYIIEDNFLVYGKSSEQFREIAKNIFGKITDIAYCPFNADCPGNPCLEVGDAVRFPTTYELVESYILSRTLKGIQALRDDYWADGVEQYAEKVNGVHKSIIQLKGKANILTRTIEETKLEMYDIEAGLNATITVTADEIRTEVSDANQNLQSQITQNASEIDLRVTKDGVVSAINLSPEVITIKADKIDLQGLVNANELVSKFATITTLNATKAELETLIAKKATIGQLEASNARIKSLEVDHVSVSDFDAEKARINTIESTYITASKVKADYMEVTNWTSAGLIKADKINVDDLFANRAVNKDLHVKGFFLGNNYFSMNNKNIGFVTISISGKTYKLLGEIE